MKNPLFLLLASLIFIGFFSCKKDNSSINPDPTPPTPEELRGLIKTHTYLSTSSGEVKNTFYYNSQRHVIRIVVSGIGNTSFQYIYSYFNGLIVRHVTDTLGNIISMSDSLFLNQNGLVHRWAQYALHTNGEYRIVYLFSFEYDDNDYMTKALYRWDYPHDTCRTPIYYQISDGNTDSGYRYESCSEPHGYYYFSFTHSNTIYNTLEPIYYGSPFQGRKCKNPMLTETIIDNSGDTITDKSYNYSVNDSGYIIEKIVNGIVEEAITYY